MQSGILVGTSKGLIVYSSKSRRWDIQSVQFEGLPVSLVYVDDRSNTWWIGLSHRHWGEKLYFSPDQGKNWNQVSTPAFNGKFYRPGHPAGLRKIWVMQHAGKDHAGGLWVGTEPGALFYSADSGITFHINEGLWNHPGRQDPNQWFGAGKDYPFVHSIVLDPNDSNHLYVAVSCAGVFETTDHGKTWKARNNGLVAAYLPNPKPEVGHDPHRMMLCTADPKVIWQQNHCGIFRSDNGGELWKDVSGPNGFPKYGFALAVDETDPFQAWVIPAQSDERRIPVDLKLCVCHTVNGGKSWERIDRGVPTTQTFDLVLRHAFVKQQEILAFGTNNGNLYVSEDSGESWQTLSTNLSAINYLAFA